MNSKIFFTLTLLLSISNIQSNIFQTKVSSITKLDDKQAKEFYICLLKTDFGRLYGEKFINFVFENTKDEKDSKIIQRYFSILADYYVNNIKFPYSKREKINNYCLATYLKKDVKNNLRHYYNRLSQLTIKEIEKEMLNEEVYFIVHGQIWNKSNQTCPIIKKDIIIVHEAIKRVVEKIKTN